MTITRLRPYPDRAALTAMYPRPHDHTVFADHERRVEATVELGIRFVQDTFPDQDHITITDLSCGNAAIAERLRRQGDSLILGDFAPGYHHTGRIETTIRDTLRSDLFICCETLEHVEDPAAVLRQIRARSAALLFSTPMDNFDDDNPEHIWSWSRQDLEQLLERCGWTIGATAVVDTRPEGYPYCWFIVGAS